MSRGLLRDCTTSPINRFAALVLALDRAAARGPGLPPAGPSWSQHGRGGRRGSKLMSNDDIEFL